MLRELMNTQPDYSLALARIALGVAFFAHGAQKMLGLVRRSRLFGNDQPTVPGSDTWGPSGQQLRRRAGRAGHFHQSANCGAHPIAPFDTTWLLL